MAEILLCPVCGEQMTTDAISGICPKCLLQAGFGQSNDNPSRTRQSGDVGETVANMPADLVQICDTLADLGALEHYDIEQILGRGGMGVVLRAVDTRLNRAVAVKVLAPELASNAVARKRFLREAQSTATITHDHVVAIHDINDNDKLPFLVMECVEGKSLQQHIDDDGPLPVENVLRIGSQIASGLDAAHVNKLVHRDIKPSNILLEAGSGRVKITDFGLAKAVADAQITQTNSLAGTPLYMSPEQAEGLPVDARSDLFSLGSVMYAMCTATGPFQGNSTVAVLREVCDGTPPPIRELNPDIPDWLVAIIDKLMAKDPANRYASATEISELLEERLAHHRNAPEMTQPIEPLRSNRRKRGLAIAAFLLVIVGALGLSEAAGVTNLRGVVATILRIETPNGTLVVEVNDPKIEVTVTGDGVSIKGAGPQQINLKPGRYKVTAKRDANGKVHEEWVTVTRDGRPVVRVRLEPHRPTVDVRQAFYDRVAKLSAPQQVEAVRQKLMEVNPGFDGNVKHRIIGVRVREFGLKTDLVTQIWPVRALSDLELLRCQGNQIRQGKLADISPLRGLKLHRLYMRDNPISDLSPLEGMPLRNLGMGFTDVSDLTPLKGMPLVHLWLGVTPVSDLSPLKGMPLKELHCNATKVSDLTPLKGMPLEVLWCNDISAPDLSLLNGLPLQDLWVNVRLFHEPDLALLRSLSLKEFRIAWNETQSADEFWKQVDARRQKAETFAAETGKLRGQKQVAAVRAKLGELNGVVGVLLPKIENGAVTAMELGLTKNSNDISPLRALTQLKKLTLVGGAAWIDLSPLNALPLEALDCSDEIIFRNSSVLRSTKALRTINGQPAIEHLMSLSAKLATADKTLEVAGNEIAQFYAGRGALNVNYSPDGRYLLRSGFRGLNLMDAESGAEISRFGKGHVADSVFSPDGRTILSTSEHGELQLWDVKTKKVVRTFTGHQGTVLSIRFSRDGKYAVSGGTDATVRLWDVEKAKEINLFEGHKKAVSNVAFAKDAKYILSGSDDNTLRLWDIQSGKQVAKMLGHDSGHPGGIHNCVEFLPDGERAVSSGQDGRVCFWDLKTGRKTSTWQAYSSPGYVRTLDVSPDGRFLLTCSGALHPVFKVRLWNLHTNKEIFRFKGHTDRFTDVAFSPDLKSFASISFDGTICIGRVPETAATDKKVTASK